MQGNGLDDLLRSFHSYISVSVTEMGVGERNEWVLKIVLVDGVERSGVGT